MTRHRLMWFVVGVGIVVSVHCALGEKPRKAPEVLEIKVIDTATGKAMPGVSLRYAGYSGQSASTNTTSLGPGGTTRLTWSQVERYRLTFMFTIGGRKIEIHRMVEAEDANAASLILRIRTSRYKKPLIVTVVDAETARPVPEVRLNLSFRDLGDVGSNVHQTADTSAKGEAAIHWAGEGSYRIWCSHIAGRELVSFRLHTVVAEDNWKAGKLTWKMKVPKLSARVKVFLLSGGKKIPAPDGAGFGIRSAWKFGSGGTSRELQAVCKDGKAQFYGLRAGSVNRFCALSGVLGHKSGILGTKHAPIGVKPWPFKGKVLDLEATLVSAKEYRGKLAVRVTDEKGAPVDGATVELTGAGGGKGTTNSAGLAALSGLHIGRYSVSVRREGFCAASRRGIRVPDTDEVVITLIKAYSLDVKVLDPAGKATETVGCLAMPLSQRQLGPENCFSKKGQTRVEKLHKGYYLVLAGAGKGKGTIFERDRGGAVVSAAKTTEVTIRLRKVHPVRIELTAAKGAKVPAKPRFGLVSAEASDLLPDTGDKVMLAEAAYLVYLRMTARRYVLLGKHTVTGPGTVKFDLKGAKLDRADWLLVERLLGKLLPKARPAVQ